MSLFVADRSQPRQTSHPTWELATDLEQSPALLLPGGLRSGERYHVVADPSDPLANTVEAMMAWASPGAVCVGVGNVPPSDTTLVLFQPDALRRSRRLVESGAARPDALRFMPIPFGSPWAFWDTWTLFADRPDLLSRLASFEAFKHFFDRSPYLRRSSSAPALTDWNARRQESLYWTDMRGAFKAHSEELESVRCALADDRSRAIFDMALESDPERLWRHYVSTVFTTADYLEADAPGPGEHVLNLGVFTGSEVPYFTVLVGSRGVVHCIDPVGFALLSDYVRAYISTVPQRASEVRFAASAFPGSAGFRSYPDGQVCLDAVDSFSPQVFPTATIDDYVQTTGIPSVGFVKIDVEGMEFEALAGMRRTIEAHRPTISIAIYHEADHLWRIPQCLMATLKDYRFHVSHGSPVRWETVLTAVPNERPQRGLRQP